jgi:hypothetical protein
MVDKLEELLGADHRPRVSRECNDGECSEHGVDRAAL